MGIEKEFLADIREHPDDDAPRLIYADWLDEHGDEARAEFIRAQIEMEKLAPDDIRRRDLVLRQHALESEHKARWAGELKGLVESCWFRRGMPEKVMIAPANFIQYG